jgi:carboxypeptidase T
MPMKQLFLKSLILLFAFLPVCFYAQAPKYSKVKIYTDDSGIRQLQKAGIALDHGEYKKGDWFVSDFSDSELKAIRLQGFKTEVLIDDVSAFYRQRNESGKVSNTSSLLNAVCNSPNGYPVPSGFKYGSMGGFPTLTEILSDLDSLAIRYPNLVKAKAPINATRTAEGRPLYWLRISNNPNVDQNKPRILYTALHHAREPESVAQMLYYMHFLCENYASNAEVKYIVDHTEMYFVPCVNPDGYVYNQTINPAGGGLWRKNRRNNNDSTYGVDLNRNYGYDFARDNIGSSPATSSDTYRGVSAFSEPETAMIRYLDSLNHFRIAVNYHTYGNDLLYPWGDANASYTPDSALFSNYTKLMTEENHFAAGTAIQTVGYLVNGDSDDWSYGERSTKPKIFAMSPEIGSSSDGFWPAVTAIVPICQQVLVQNLNAALCLTQYADVKDESPYYIGAASGFLKFRIKRLGLDSPASYTVSIVPLSAEITGIGSLKTYSNLSLLQEIHDSISFSLKSPVGWGTPLSYIIQVSNGSYSWSDTVRKAFGKPMDVYSCQADSMNGWTSTSWGTSTAFYVSPSSSITDSPSGNYPNNADELITMVNPLNLFDTKSARLSFWARWQLESGYDYVELQVSSDMGTTWVPQCGQYTIAGTGNQDPGKPVYNGFQLAWVKEEISLDDYRGKSILLRFELKSDAGVNYDGFYFDDLLVQKVVIPEGIQESHASSQPFVSSCRPNPAKEEVLISYELKDNAFGTLTLYNSIGLRVQEELTLSHKGDLHLDVSGLPAGVYFYRMESAGVSSASRKLIILK